MEQLKHVRWDLLDGDFFAIKIDKESTPVGTYCTVSLVAKETGQQIAELYSGYAGKTQKDHY